jgi:hypothetical protein
VYTPTSVYVADKTCAAAPLIVTAGIAKTSFVPVGTVPLGTAGVMVPNPVAVISTVLPGAAFVVAMLAVNGTPTLVPCTKNIPRSMETTVNKNGALVEPFAVTVAFTDGTPAGISNGTCTLICVGLT